LVFFSRRSLISAGTGLNVPRYVFTVKNAKKSVLLIVLKKEHPNGNAISVAGARRSVRSRVHWCTKNGKLKA